MLKTKNKKDIILINEKNKKTKSTKNSDSKVNKKLTKYMNKAEKISDNEKDKEHLFDKISKLMDRLPKLSDKIYQPVKKIWDYIKDPTADKVLKIAGIGVLIYLISPIDAVPDFTPVIGFLDDIASITIFAGIITKNISDSVQNSKEAITTVTKSLADGISETLSEKATEQSNIRIKQQLIITSISLGGAIIIGIIALLLSQII